MSPNTTLILRYHTNFTLNQHTKTNYLQTITQQKLKKKIYCKNFFFLMLILEFLHSCNTNNGAQNRHIPGVYTKHKIVCHVFKKQTLTYLRAPNRAKSSQVSLMLPRYVIALKICFYNIKTLSFISNPIVTINYLLVLQKQFNFFETNLLNLISLKILLKYHFKK